MRKPSRARDERRTLGKPSMRLALKERNRSGATRATSTESVPVNSHRGVATFGARCFACDYPGRRSSLAVPWAFSFLGLRPAAAVTKEWSCAAFRELVGKLKACGRQCLAAARRRAEAEAYP
jgi:hypothetical protein